MIDSDLKKTPGMFFVTKYVLNLLHEKKRIVEPSSMTYI